MHTQTPQLPNKIEEIPLRDYSHTRAIAKLIPAVNELCRHVNAMGEAEPLHGSETMHDKSCCHWPRFFLHDTCECSCHKESTHSELKPTQCEMCQAVNELAPSLSYCPDHKYSVETTSSDEEVERIVSKFHQKMGEYHSTDSQPLVKNELENWLRSTLLSFGKQQRDEGKKVGYQKGVEAAVDITRKAPSWSEAIQDIKKLIE